jgi:hypothetical protein
MNMFIGQGLSLEARHAAQAERRAAMLGRRECEFNTTSSRKFLGISSSPVVLITRLRQAIRGRSLK